MVTLRTTKKESNDIRKYFNDYLTSRGTTVTLRKNTQTYDSMGRLSTNTVTTSTIQADIQFVSKWNIDHVNIGGVQVGDGMLFVLWDADVDLEDEVEFNSERWKIEEQIEGEQVGGSIVSKGFLIRRNTQ